MLNLLFPSLDKSLSYKIKQNLEEDFKNSDRMMLIITVILAFLIAAGTSITYETYTFGIVSGTLLLAIALIAYKFFAGTFVSRAVFGIIFMVASSIMITQQMGLIEMHFGFFY